MFNANTPDSAFAFNNPVYCDWKVAITSDRSDAASPSRKRQKKLHVGVEVQTFLVSAAMLARQSEYFRLTFDCHDIHFWPIQLSCPS